MRNGGQSMPTEPVPRLMAERQPTDGQLLERFADDQDAAAFATLIQRHGPMVLGVCRRVLNHEQEAEDAFQATFLVLVRRAGGLERPELLGNWLYGVAYRTAHKARARLARRRYHERQVQPMPAVEPPDPLQWQELRGVLDEALRELPGKYRAPLVLCYLQGLTNEEAARRLGWPTGSMSYRLARGRQLLRERLEQRRQMLPGMLVLALLKQHAAPEDVPADLAQATLRAALGQPPDPLPPLWPVSTAATSAGATTAAKSGAGAASAASSAITAAPRRWTRRALVALLAAGVVAAYLALNGGYDMLARAIGLDPPATSVDSTSSGSGATCH
jgi:RNA polymerase sigma factor (sigma-70 family)